MSTAQACPGASPPLRHPPSAICPLASAGIGGEGAEKVAAGIARPQIARPLAGADERKRQVEVDQVDVAVLERRLCFVEDSGRCRRRSRHRLVRAVADD